MKFLFATKEILNQTLYINFSHPEHPVPSADELELKEPI